MLKLNSLHKQRFKKFLVQEHYNTSWICEMESFDDILSVTEKCSVGGYLAQRLTQVGVTHFFTVPGDFILSLLDELCNSSHLTMVGCCSELTAGYAADGYCRASGQLGVAVVTYMVGGLSLINAVAGAYSEDLPMLVISGGPNSNDLNEGNLTHHTIGDHHLYQSAKCFEPVVAKTFVIRHLQDAVSSIDKAISACLSEQKPVYLEIPCNFTLQSVCKPCPIDDMRYFHQASDNKAMHACVDHILHLVGRAERPLLMAGSKLRRSNAVEEFMHLANALGCGVVVLPDAKGLINEENASFLGMYWGEISSCEELRTVVERSDLLIYVGPVFNDYTTVGWTVHDKVEQSIVVNAHHTMVLQQRYHHVNMNSLLSALAVRVPLKEQSMLDYQSSVGDESVSEKSLGSCRRNFVPINDIPSDDDEHAEGNAAELMATELKKRQDKEKQMAQMSSREEKYGMAESLGGDRLNISGDIRSLPPSIQDYVTGGTRAPDNTPQGEDQSGNGHGKEANKAPQQQTELTVRGLVDELQDEILRNSNTAVLVETGDAWFIGQKLRLTCNSWYYMQMQYGSIGWALGALVGIKMVRRNCRKMIAIVGDGSFQVTCDALSTIIRQNIKATVIVMNNHGYAIEAKIHDGPYNRIQNWDYAGLVEVFKDHCAAPDRSQSEGDSSEAEAVPLSGAAGHQYQQRTKALGIRATTVEDLRRALHISDEFDGVVLVQCELRKDDCTAELVKFGRLVRASSSRM